MLLEKFRKEIKVEADNAYVGALLNDFIGADLSTIEIDNDTTLFDLYKVDVESVSSVNEADSKAFFKTLISDFKTNNPGKDTSALIDDINQFEGNLFINNSNIVNYPEVEGNLEHRITINVAGENLYTVANAIYTAAKNPETSIKMTLPDMSKQDLGYRDAITLYVSSEELASTLDLLARLDNSILSMIKSPIRLGASFSVGEFNNICGYTTTSANDTLDEDERIRSLVDKVTTDDVLSLCFFSAIDHAIAEFAQKNPEETIGNVLITDYKNNEQNRILARQRILKHINNIGYDINSKIVEYTRVALEASNVDLENIFMDKDVATKLSDLFGLEVQVQDDIVPEVKEEALLDDARSSEFPEFPDVPEDLKAAQAWFITPEEAEAKISATQTQEQHLDALLTDVVEKEQQEIPVQEDAELAIDASQTQEQHLDSLLAESVKEFEVPAPTIDSEIVLNQPAPVAETPVENSVETVQDETPEVDPKKELEDAKNWFKEPTLVAETPVTVPENALDAIAGNINVDLGGLEGVTPLEEKIEVAETQEQKYDAMLAEAKQVPEGSALDVLQDLAPAKDEVVEAAPEVVPVEEGLTNEELSAAIEKEETAPVVAETVAMDINKYAFISTDPAYFTTLVKDVDGNEITLYDYLEKYDVLTLIPLDASVITPDEGTKDAATFIREELVQYVITTGKTTVDDYVENHKITIKQAKTKKPSFFSKLLGNH